MIGQIGNLAGYALMGLGVGIVLRHVFTLLSARRRIPELLKSGAQILDVRSPSEFAAGHTSGSRNVPLADINRAAKDLDPNRWMDHCLLRIGHTQRDRSPLASPTRVLTRVERWLLAQPAVTELSDLIRPAFLLAA